MALVSSFYKSLLALTFGVSVCTKHTVDDKHSQLQVPYDVAMTLWTIVEGHRLVTSVPFINCFNAYTTTIVKVAN